MDKKKDTAPEESDIQTLILTIYNYNPYTTPTTRTGDKQMQTPPMPVPPPLLRDCIPGELLLCMFCIHCEFHRRTCFKHKTNIRQKKVQGTILLESKSAIFDI